MKNEPAAADKKPPLLCVPESGAFSHLPNPKIFHLFVISAGANFSLGVAMIVEWFYHGRHHPDFYWILYYAPSMVAFPLLMLILCLVSSYLFRKKHRVPPVLPVVDRSQPEQRQIQDTEVQIAPGNDPKAEQSSSTEKNLQIQGEILQIEPVNDSKSEQSSTDEQPIQHVLAVVDRSDLEQSSIDQLQLQDAEAQIERENGLNSEKSSNTVLAIADRSEPEQSSGGQKQVQWQLVEIEKESKTEQSPMEHQPLQIEPESDWRSEDFPTDQLLEHLEIEAGEVLIQQDKDSKSEQPPTQQLLPPQIEPVWPEPLKEQEEIEIEAVCEKKSCHLNDEPGGASVRSMEKEMITGEGHKWAFKRSVSLPLLRPHQDSSDTRADNGDTKRSLSFDKDTVFVSW